MNITVRLPFCEYTFNNETFSNSTSEDSTVFWYLLSIECRRNLLASLMVIFIIFCIGIIISSTFFLAGFKTQPPKIRGFWKLLPMESKRLKKYYKSLWTVTAIRIIVSVLSFVSSCVLLPLICISVSLLLIQKRNNIMHHLDSPTNHLLNKSSCVILHTIIFSLLSVSLGSLLSRLRAISTIQPEHYLAQTCNLVSMLSSTDVNRSTKRIPVPRISVSIYALFYLVLSSSASIFLGVSSIHYADFKLVIYGYLSPINGSVVSLGAESGGIRILYIMILVFPLALMILILPMSCYNVISRQRRASSLEGYKNALKSSGSDVIKQMTSRRHRKQVRNSDAVGMEPEVKMTSFRMTNDPQTSRTRSSSVFALKQDIDRVSRLVPVGCAQAYFGEMKEMKAAVTGSVVVIICTIPLVSLLVIDMFPIFMYRTGSEVILRTWIYSALPSICLFVIGNLIVLMTSLLYSAPLSYAFSQLLCFRKSPVDTGITTRM